MQAKEESGKTYTQIANECGLSNVYTAMLLQHQVCVCMCVCVCERQSFYF